jgi:tripeptide aminopeptidase
VKVMSVNQKRLVSQFIELTKIDSLSFSERKMADYLMQKGKELGLSLKEDDAAERIGGNAGNLYGRAEGNMKAAKELLFMAHMDTVVPGIGKKAVLHEDGRITSDGSTVLGADDAVAIAVILEAYREIKEEGLPHHHLNFLFPAAEEAYTEGMSAFDLALLPAIDRAYVPDCSDRQGTYSVCEPTLLSFELNIYGRAAHAGFDPEKGIHSIAVAAAAVSRLQQGHVNDHTTLNIGMIEGGSAKNIVPEKTSVKGEIRCSIHEEALALYEKMLSLFQEEAEKVGGRVEDRMKIHLTAYRVEEDEEGLLALKEALKAEELELLPKESFGGSDNNVLRRKGIKGLCIANAMHEIHTTEEYCRTEELVQETEIIKYLMTH